MDRETREHDDRVELRDLGVGGRMLQGYAAVFNSPSRDLGGFFEIIRPGAFKRSIEAGGDVLGLFNHNVNALLGRTSSKTLRIGEDARGLWYQIDLPDTQLGRDLAEQVRRGDVRGSSFGFTVNGASGQAWRKEGAKSVRELHDVNLLDVSPVVNPAYLAADVAVRSFQEWQRGQDAAHDLEAAKARQRRLRLAEFALRRQ